MPMIYETARAEADRLLAKHWDGHSLPVKLTPFSKALNAVKSESDLGPSLSGQVVKYVGQPARIRLNSTHSLERRRFTWAHELGHIVERENVSNDHEYSFEDEDASNLYILAARGDGYSLREFFADEFAGSLLMPESYFIPMWNSGMSDREIAGYFAVSPAAVRQRAKRLQRHPGSAPVELR